MARWNQTPLERFMAKISMSEFGCWIWTATSVGPKTHRYGHFLLDGKLMLAHRVSWLFHKGEIPEGLRVLHRCDNPLCVNPEHLFVGTQTDNMVDMVKKGRHPYPIGETHHRAKLTNDEVRAIRTSVQSHQQLANAYGVTKRTIINVRQRKVYGSVL